MKVWGDVMLLKLIQVMDQVLDPTHSSLRPYGMQELFEILPEWEQKWEESKDAMM